MCKEISCLQLLIERCRFMPLCFCKPQTLPSAWSMVSATACFHPLIHSWKTLKEGKRRGGRKKISLLVLSHWGLKQTQCFLSCSQTGFCKGQKNIFWAAAAGMCWGVLLGSELTANPHPRLANCNFTGLRRQEHRVWLNQVSHKSFLQKLPQGSRKTMLHPDRLSSSPGCRVGTANLWQSPAVPVLPRNICAPGFLTALLCPWSVCFLERDSSAARLCWGVQDLVLAVRSGFQSILPGPCVCWFCLLGDGTLQKLFCILHRPCDASPIE